GPAPVRARGQLALHDRHRAHHRRALGGRQRGALSPAQAFVVSLTGGRGDRAPIAMTALTARIVAASALGYAVGGSRACAAARTQATTPAARAQGGVFVKMRPMRTGRRKS